MSAKVEALTRHRQKGAPGEPLSEAVLVAGLGMQGDRHLGGERQLSLLLAEARRWMDAQPVPGLCFGRFKPNILIGGLASGELAVGECLCVGADAVLRIGGEAKRCFPECALLIHGAPCRLPGCAAFATVERGGVVRVGDRISALR